MVGQISRARAEPSDYLSALVAREFQKLRRVSAPLGESFPPTEAESKHAWNEEQYALKSLILNDLAVRVGFGLKGHIENTQVVDSESSENVHNARNASLITGLLRSDAVRRVDCTSVSSSTGRRSVSLPRPRPR